MKTKQTRQISKQILKIIGMGIVIGLVSLFAPQLPYLLLRAFLKRKFGQTYSRQQLTNATNYLKRKKFIAYENRGNKLRFILTKLGKKKLSQIVLDEIKIKHTPWDQQWRVISFDIPERSKDLREVFRNKLKKLEFFHFQRSVFITPFECEKEVSLITDNLDISPYVFFLTAKRFRNDRELIKKFNL